MSEPAANNHVEELLEQVIEMTQAQAAALDRQNFDRLAQVTQAKQTLVDRLRRDYLSALAKNLHPEIKNKIMRIAAMEKYNIRVCSQKEVEIGAALSKVMQSRLAARNYRPDVRQQRSIDRQR